jgi:hypothetical protein
VNSSRVADFAHRHEKNPKGICCVRTLQRNCLLIVYPELKIIPGEAGYELGVDNCKVFCSHCVMHVVKPCSASIGILNEKGLKPAWLEEVDTAQVSGCRCLCSPQWEAADKFSQAQYSSKPFHLSIKFWVWIVCHTLICIN